MIAKRDNVLPTLVDRHEGFFVRSRFYNLNKLVEGMKNKPWDSLLDHR